MVRVAERVDQADHRVRRWRRRTLLAVVLAAAVIGGAAWALTREPAVSLQRSPIEHGPVSGALHCDDGVRTRTVDDTFGGGGTIADYVEGARCEAVLSISNTTDVPVAVLGVERTDDDVVEPLRLVGATRDPKPMSGPQDCYGCPDQYVPFSPWTIAAGDDWEVAVQGLMRHCRPREAGEPYSTHVRDTLDFTVEFAGIRTVVTVQLQQPWAVRTHGCGDGS